MEKRYYSEYSQCLDRNMDFIVYGHSGVPLLVFPAQDGHPQDYENFGMVDVIKDKIENGYVQLFCVGSIDEESYSDEMGDKARRSYLLEQFYYYICDEIVPRIKEINYIDFNEIQGNNDKIKKNYSVTDNSVILDSYKNAISNNKYLSNIDFTTGDEVVKQLIKSPFLAYKIDNKTYFSEKSVTNHLEDLDLSKEKHININGENYFSIDIIKNSNIYSVLELSDKVIVKKGI